MIQERFQQQKNKSIALRKSTAADRLTKLSQLKLAIEKHTSEIIAALEKDFSKPQAETLVTEIYPTLKEIDFVEKKLSGWMSPVRVSSPILMTGSRSFIQYEPRGVCLIISPWNYPFNLAMAPLISAIAAGNCVFLKPSEYCQNTNAVIHKIITENFANDEVTLVEGGVQETQELLKLPFDHIFFTGSTATGKIVMEAASKNLAHVTLELGGKSPTIVDDSASLSVAAEKIAWAKFINAGQTCVAPDYLLIHESVFEEFKKLLIEQIQKFYGKSHQEVKDSKDFARIINTRHFERLKKYFTDALVHGAQVSYGGHLDESSNYFSPTLLSEVSLESEIMKEEIFGPLLPMIKVNSMDEAISFVNSRPKPLALYFYSSHDKNIQRVTQETSSGGLCINDSMIHLGNLHLPFGGVGPSGLGSYHGQFGFKNFSHEKALLRQSWLGRLLRIIYPPYTPFKRKLIKSLIQWRP